MDFVQYVLQNAPKYRLDPQAVIAVARTEGGLVNRADDRGDGGRSFGPHQLFEGGELPRQFVGNPDAADAWAWSPAGFDYALRRMAETGAAGLKGQEAIRKIVYDFERPADKAGEVRKAIGYLSSSPKGVPASADQGRKTTASGIRELFYDPLGAYDEGNWINPIGGHSDHVHASFGTPETALWAIKLAKSLGLRATENPYAEGSPAEPGVHTPTSYHYRNFDGMYDGRQLGQGLDVSGSADLMAKYFNQLKNSLSAGLPAGPSGPAVLSQQPAAPTQPAAAPTVQPSVPKPQPLPDIPKPPVLAAPQAPPDFVSQLASSGGAARRFSSLVDDIARSVFG